MASARNVRRAAAVAGLLLGAAVLVMGFFEPAEASCIGPAISLSHDEGAPGTEVVVTGMGFAASCNDVVSCAPGQPCGPPPPPEPAKGIEVGITRQPQANVRLAFITLARVDADADYGFKVAIRIPEGTPVGAIFVRAMGGFGEADASFRVTGPTSYASWLIGGIAVLAILVATVVLARRRPNEAVASSGNDEATAP